MELASISSFNLGVAITAISILLALASFSLNTKFDLRVKLRVKLMWLVVILSGSSIGLTFLAEFSNIFQPFILQITGAIFMVIAIILYTFIIFRPIKTINIHNSHRLIDNLNKFLIRRNQNELLKNLDDITYFYDSLLNNSTKNSDLRQVFNQIFTSNLFLTLFSEHPYLFEKTIHFYIQNQEKLLPVDLYHIKQFINDLFVKSLNNQNSFLNSFLNEEIYPNSRSYLDDLFVERIGVNYSDLLFRDIRFNSLSIEGKLSYMKMVKHYFQVIHRKNMSHKNTDGYEKKVDYNSNLIKNFFEDKKVF